MRQRSWAISAVVALGGLAAAIGGADLAFAAETITYKYDAKGRVVQVIHSGSVNSNVISNYSFDDADNRTRVKVTGAP